MTENICPSEDPPLLDPAITAPPEQRPSKAAERPPDHTGPIYQLTLEDGKVIRVVGTELLLELMDNKKWVSARLEELSREEAATSTSDAPSERVYRGEVQGVLAPFFGPLRIETMSEGTSRLRLTLLTLS